MLVWGSPLWLAAGALAALVPVGLHFLVRSDRSAAPLPTFRFLHPDPRARVRVRRRPTDLPLLLLRVLLLLGVGAALAAPRWLPEPAGTAEMVLLDRGAGMQGTAWRSAVDSARALLLDAEGAPRGRLVLFDTVAIAIPPARLTYPWFDSLAAAGPGGAPVRYAAALRALAGTAREAGHADSLRATLLTRPRWEGWSAGLAPLRAAAWSGAIRLPPLPGGEPPPPADSAELRGRVRVLGGRGEGFAAAALGAVGWEVRPGGALPADSAAAVLLLGPPPEEQVPALLARVRRGATLVAAGRAARGALAGALPWVGGGDPIPAAGALLIEPDWLLPGARVRFPGGPRPDARLIAAWESGAPAAVARRFGAGCLVYVATELEGGTLPLSPAYPRALDRLLRACRGNRSAAGRVAGEDALPLDRGALALLRGADRPGRVAARRLGAAERGIPFARWAWIATLGVALMETLLAARADRAR